MSFFTPDRSDRVQKIVHISGPHQHILSYQPRGIANISTSNDNVICHQLDSETIFQLLSNLSWEFSESIENTRKQVTGLFINSVIKSIYNNKANYFKTSNNFLSSVITETNRISTKIIANIKPSDCYYSYLIKIVRILDTWCHRVYNSNFKIEQRPLLLSKISEFNQTKLFMVSSKLYLEQSQQQTLSTECLNYEQQQLNNICFKKQTRNTLKVDIISKIIEYNYLIPTKHVNFMELIKYIDILCNIYINHGSTIAYVDELYEQRPFILIMIIASMLFNTLPTIYHPHVPPSSKKMPVYIFGSKKLIKMINYLKLIKYKFEDKTYKRLIDIGIADVKLARHVVTENDIKKVVKIIWKTSNYIVHTNLSEESIIFAYHGPSRIWCIYNYLIYNGKRNIMSEALHDIMQQLKAFVRRESNPPFHNPDTAGYISGFLMSMLDDNRYGHVLKNIIKGKRCNYRKCQNRGTKLKKCKRCRKSYYCNEYHQKLDWKYGDHRSNCVQLKINS